jgi:hypothetical protein
VGAWAARFAETRAADGELSESPSPPLGAERGTGLRLPQGRVCRGGGVIYLLACLYWSMASLYLSSCRWLGERANAASRSVTSMLAVASRVSSDGSGCGDESGDPTYAEVRSFATFRADRAKGRSGLPRRAGAIVHAMYFAGLRVSGVCSKRDFSQKTMTLRVRSGKGARDRANLGVHAKTWAVFERWAAIRPSSRFSSPPCAESVI